MRVYIIAVRSLISVESPSSACLNSLEFAEIRIILFVPLCDCNNAALMPNFEASHIAYNCWSGSGMVLEVSLALQIVFDVLLSIQNFFFDV